MSNRLKELVKIIQAKTGETMQGVADSIGYSRGHLSRLVNNENEIDGRMEMEALLEARHSEILQNVTFSPKGGNKGKGDNFSPEQLYAMFMRVAEMQTGILKSIESKMAQETTQARIETNLGNVVRDVTKLVERQHFAIEEIRDQFSQLKVDKKNPSKGVRKKDDQNGDNG